MSDHLLATLDRIGLTQIPADPANPQMRWAFEAGAVLTDPAGAPLGAADLRIGLGNAPDADALFTAARTAEAPGLIDALRGAQAVWLGTGTNAVMTNGIPDRPVWLAVFSTDGVDLLGAHPLPANTLDAAGLLTFPSPVLLRMRIRLRGDALERAEASLEGPVRAGSSIGPVELAGVNGTFRLALAGVDPRSLGAVLTNPAAIFDARFQATLDVELRTSQPVALLDASITGTQVVRLHADVTSPARARTLAIQRLRYEHEITGGGLTIGGAVPIAATQLTLSGELSQWTPAAGGTVTLRGAGTFSLPPQVRAIVNGPGSNLTGSFALIDSGQGAARMTTIELSLGALRLASSINPLEISAQSLRLTLAKQGNGSWSLTLGAELRQSWTRLAARLRAASIVQLPEIERLPDVACVTTITVGAAATDVAVRLTLENGRLGPFPIEVEETFIELTLQVGGAWSAAGGGRFTSRDALAALVPFQRLPIGCSLSAPAGAGAGGGVPLLEFTIGAGLPPLVLPPIVRGGQRIDLLTLESLTVRFGAELSFAGRVRLLPSLGNTATRLGLPSALRPVLDPLFAAARAATGDLRFTLDDDQPSLTITLSADPATPALDLFGLFAQAVPGRAPVPAAGARASSAMPPLLLVKPASLTFETRGDRTDGARLLFSIAALCDVQGETFDATLSVSAAGANVEISLLAGTTDPILIRIPASGTRALVATIDQQVQAVLAQYGINRSSQAARDLQSVATGLKTTLGNPEVETLIAFEIIDLGLTLRLAPGEEPLSIAGGIRIVQFPPLLDAIFTGPTPALIIGSSGTSIFIELRPAPASGPGTPPPPLIRIPVTNNANVDVVLHAVRFGYSWQPPSFEVTLRADVIAPDMPFNGGVGFKLPAGSSTAASASIDIDLQVPSPPAPPVPILNWQMSFLGANPTPATRGLEFIVGASETNRFLTIYLREAVFSPCFFLLMPGGMIDWGIFLGPPPGSRNAGTFYAEFRCGRGTMITINPVIGVMLNPMALLPPFLQPTPPYWVIPGLLMGDYFTDETGQTGIELRANLPLLAEFEAVVKRPMPTMTLQMFLEIALLVSLEFDVELPPNSALRNLFYASLSGRLTIHALRNLFGANAADLAATAEFNIVEILNGAIRLSKQVREAIDDAGRAMARTADLVADLTRDPATIVKMVPRRQRSIALDTRLEALGFALDCSLSAHVLMPDELREELRMFHENVRPRRKSPGAFDEPPPAGPIIDRPIDFDLDVVRDVTRVIGHRDFVRDITLTRFEGKGKALLRAEAGPSLTAARTRVLDASATRIAAEIESSAGAVRGGILQRYGLAGKRQEIEDDERRLPDRKRFRDAVEAKVKPELRRSVKYSVAVSVVLPSPIPDIARRLADDLVQERSPGRLTLRDAAGITSLLRKYLPAVVAKKMARDIATRIGPLLPTRVATPVQIAAIRAQLPRVVVDLLEQASIVGRNASVDADDLETAAETLVANAWMRDKANTAIRTTRDSFASAVLRGSQLREWFRGFRPGLVDVVAPVLDDDTDDPQGYEIRVRTEHAALAPGFAVAVPSVATRFRVRLRGGAFRLAVIANGVERDHDLPAAFVASIPIGPRKANDLQRRLTIVERRVRRPLTSKEQARRKEGQDQHVPGLYKKSIFHSPEYEIRDEGGVRGPLTIADLLRRANGTYVVPNQPIALAGFRLQILAASSGTGGLAAAFTVRFCGLAAPGSHLLCFAYADQTLRFGPFRVELAGEFRLAVGDIATVQIPGSAAIAPNSMTFGGHVRLRDGNRTLLAGDALATIGPVNGVTTIQVTTTVHVEWEDEFEIGGVKLIKAWVSADLDVSLTLGRTMAASLDAGITLHYSIGEFDTDTHTVGWEVCVPLTDICWRETKRVEVIDLSEMVWGPEQTIAGRLVLDLRSSTAGAAFRGRLTAAIPLPGGGSHAISADLPAFAI